MKNSDNGLGIVREVFARLDADGYTLRGLSRASGVCTKSLMDWKHRLTAPRLDLFISLANAAGFDVVLKRRKQE